MRHLTERLAVATLGIALATVPLTGCFGGSDKADSDADDAIESVEEDSDAEDIGVRKPTGDSNFMNWSTLGDAFAAAEMDPDYSYDESCYMALIETGERSVYVAASLNPDIYSKVSEIDIMDDDATKKMEDILAPLPIAFKDDATAKRVPEAELNAFVGKTGQDLVNAGYTFRSYDMYGSNETMASYDRGYWCYSFTFAASVSEGSIEDGGASVLTATITGVDAENVNSSNIAFDPAHVSEITGGAVAGTPAIDEGTDVLPEDGTAPEDATIDDGVLSDDGAIDAGDISEEASTEGIPAA